MKVATRVYKEKLVNSIGSLFIVFFFLVPFIWMVLMSFKTRLQTFAIPPRIFFTPTLENY